MNICIKPIHQRMAAGCLSHTPTIYTYLWTHLYVCTLVCIFRYRCRIIICIAAIKRKLQNVCPISLFFIQHKTSSWSTEYKHVSRRLVFNASWAKPNTEPGIPQSMLDNSFSQYPAYSAEMFATS